MSVTRRFFLKSSAAVATSGAVKGNAFSVINPPSVVLSKGVGNKWEGRVVINYNKQATIGMTVNNDIVIKMVNDAILLLTGESSIGAAWKSIFPPSLTAQSKVAIKINVVNTGNPRPQPISVKPVIDGLKQMDFNGVTFPAENITIYDGNNKNSMDRAGYTSKLFPNINRVKDTAQKFGDGALNNRSYAKTLNAADFLINIFSPRGHGAAFEGFTLGFKSHYGTYSNPKGLHGSKAPGYLRDINSTGPVFNKTVLSICSGIFGMNELKGPIGGSNDYSRYSKTIDITSKNKNPTTIIMSTDPVSCEMQAIKMMRLNNGRKYGVNDMPRYLKASGGVSGALTPTYNIGIIDESQMDVRKIINGQGMTTAVKDQTGRIQHGNILKAIQLNKQPVCYIEFSVPAYDIQKRADIEIVNVRGAVVRTFTTFIQGMVNNLSWDQKAGNGRYVSKGLYIIRLKTPSLNVRTKLNIV